MQLSLNWLNRYVDIQESVDELSDMLTLLGFEAEDGIDVSTIHKVVTAHVISVEKHPNADKLSVCTVNDGTGEHQVICGAPNVRDGLNVFMAQIGAEFVGGLRIKKAKLRGVESFGMLCSEKELKLSDDHSGIMELPENTEPGISFIDYYNANLASIELDITPNRPDALSHFGIAREVALKTGRPLSPYSSRKPAIPQNKDENIDVVIDDPDGCPRYIAGVVKNLKIGSSPDWMVQCLTAAGQRSINNVVDISNFVLLEMGHPTHIFDYRLIPSKTIAVKKAVHGQEFITLDEEKRVLNEDHLLITDGENPIALAGIMGGLNTAVAEDTKDVLIESAYFDPVTIRKGSKSLGMLTEASRRFERGADIDGVEAAFWRVVELLEDYAGGTLASEMVDNYARKIEQPEIKFRVSRVEDILGYSVPEDTILTILSGLGITVKSQNGLLVCIPPTYRPDLTREIDLIEEIVRIHGYDNIPESLSFSSLFPVSNPDLQSPVIELINTLKGFGFYQCYNNSLQSLKVAGISGKTPIETLNPLGEQMAVLRTSLLPAILENTIHNINNGSPDQMLFEIGQIHYSRGSGFENYTEVTSMSGLICGHHHIRDIHKKESVPFTYFHLKGFVKSFIRDFLKSVPSFDATQSMLYNHALNIIVQGDRIGQLGKVSKQLLSDLNLKVKTDLFAFELDVNKLLELKERPAYTGISVYPVIDRDLNFVFDNSVLTNDVIQRIKDQKFDHLVSIDPMDVFTHESLGAGKKSIVYKLLFQSDVRTLEDSEVNSIINEIISVVESSFDGKLRSL